MDFDSNILYERIGPKDYTKEKYAEKSIAAMIITTRNGDSYDHLYQMLPQTPPDPDQYVSVYSFLYSRLDTLLSALKSITLQGENNNNNNNDIIKYDNENLREIVDEMKQLSGENIVLNFECCVGCEGAEFKYEITIFELTKLAIDKKFVIMFSDFSLKALINKWDAILGPNPFHTLVGSCNYKFTLEFEPTTLIDCPFAQLQNVGELCEKGIAISAAMANTILYTVKSDYLDQNPPYKLTCLTVVTEVDGVKKESSPDVIVIGEKKGLAGHVMLEYENGGKLLTSCGHWVELLKLDVSFESVLKLYQKQFGDKRATIWCAEMDQLSIEEQNQKLQFDSFTFVQSAAPCQYKRTE